MCDSSTDLNENQKAANSVENPSPNITMLDPAKEWAKDILKEMCANVTDSEAVYKQALEASETMGLCILNLLEPKQIQNQTVETSLEDESDLGLDE